MPDVIGDLQIAIDRHAAAAVQDLALLGAARAALATLEARELARDRVAIVGARNWPRERAQVVVHAVRQLAPRTIVVTGDCRNRLDAPRECSVDHVVRDAALECGLIPVVCCAPWEAAGYPAGPWRNQVVAELADRVIAFDRGGPGTASVVREFRRLGKPVDRRT